MKLMVNDVRCAFLNVFEATAFEDGGKPKFNGKFVIVPGSAQAKALDDAMLAVATEKWGAKADTIFAKLVKTGAPKNIEVAYVHEPYCNKEGDVYDGFEDMHYLSATNEARPTVLDRDKTPLIPADGRPYSGCYVNASIELWPQDNKWGRAIRATLKGIQFVKDGDAFSGGGAASPDDFSDLSEGAKEPALA